MKLKRTMGLLIVAASVGIGGAVATAATTSTATTTEATAPAAGKHWHRHHGGMLVGVMLRATHQLNLTPEQQQQIKGILSAARSQHAQAAGAAPMDMTVLGNPGDPNYATAVQSAKSRLAARMQTEIELQGQIYNVLTAQQKQQLPQVLASMKAKAQQRRAAWQQQHAAGQPAAAAGSD